MNEYGAGRQSDERTGTERTFTPDFLTELFHNPLDPGYADAAARRKQAGPPSASARVRSRAFTTVTLLVVGLLLAVAYLQTVAEEPERIKGRATLADQIVRSEAETDELARRADQLREEVARLRDAALSGSDAARLRKMEAATGLARVHGDGVVVRVSDGPSGADAVTGAGGTNLGRVYDRDLQHIANALWSAGAEAISINGQRLTSTSQIRLAGSAILVNSRPVVGPYEVSAIGPDQMERRFQGSLIADVLRGVARKWGMGFQVRRADDLTLPAAGEPELRYAQPPPTPTPTGSGSSTTSPPSGVGASTSPSGGG